MHWLEVRIRQNCSVSSQTRPNHQISPADMQNPWLDLYLQTTERRIWSANISALLAEYMPAFSIRIKFHYQALQIPHMILVRKDLTDLLGSIP